MYWRHNCIVCGEPVTTRSEQVTHICRTCGKENPSVSELRDTGSKIEKSDDAITWRRDGEPLPIRPRTRVIDKPVVTLSASNQSRGSLLDISFNRLLFPKFVKAIYLIALVVVALQIIGGVIGGLAMAIDARWDEQILMGIGMALLSPVAGVILLIWIRICLEIVLVFFLIHDELKLFHRSHNEATEKTAATTTV